MLPAMLPYPGIPVTTGKYRLKRDCPATTTSPAQLPPLVRRRHGGPGASPTAPPRCPAAAHPCGRHQAPARAPQKNVIPTRLSRPWPPLRSRPAAAAAGPHAAYLNVAGGAQGREGRGHSSRGTLTIVWFPDRRGELWMMQHQRDSQPTGSVEYSVPGGTVSVLSPRGVATVTLAPSTASYSISSRLECRSLPRR